MIYFLYILDEETDENLAVLAELNGKSVFNADTSYLVQKNIQRGLRQMHIDNVIGVT